ncbi:amidohydrolase [Ancrocorticia populi]|nr:amidohydrolase [Ancrocorticia populi]
MAVEQAKDIAQEEILKHKDAILELNHEIHADPELSWEEFRAMERIASFLRNRGFDVTTGVYGCETSFEAVIGSGDLTVTLCSEYDALPAIGHGCGHNVIATIGVGAAIALAPLVEDAGITLKLLGTPAEEHGGGKVTMLREGAWEDSDFSMMVHGMAGADISAHVKQYTAVDRFRVTYHGQGAHAAAAPWAGKNALSAASIALHAIALLRQHMPSDVNMNGYISESGHVTNIIPEKAVVEMEVRALDIDTWRDAKARVLKCFEAGALAAGCTWEWEAVEYAYAPVDQDEKLADLWDANLAGLGRELVPGSGLGGGSTDMGNVTQVLPAIHSVIAFLGQEAALHTREFAAAARTEAADQATIDAGTALAFTALDVALTPELRKHYQDLKAARPAGTTTVTLEA